MRSKRKPGRREQERDGWATILLRIPAPLAEILDEVVASENMTRSDIIRRAIEREVCL